MRYAPIRPILLATAAAALLVSTGRAASAADYDIDPAHSFVEFKVSHLGVSWLFGRFNKMSGKLTHEPGNPAANAITVTIDPATVDTNHAERDKHLRNDEFLDVGKYASASFKSTRYEGTDAKGTLHGDLTLHGATRPIAIEVEKVGEGPDPWGGYRVGYLGRYVLTRKDFGMEYNLGPAGETVEITLNVEGKRKK